MRRPGRRGRRHRSQVRGAADAEGQGRKSIRAKRRVCAATSLRASRQRPVPQKDAAEGCELGCGRAEGQMTTAWPLPASTDLITWEPTWKSLARESWTFFMKRFGNSIACVAT